MDGYDVRIPKSIVLVLGNGFDLDRNALVRANYQNLQKGIYKETIHLESFFRNLLMGEDNALMNRYLHIKAKELLDGATPTSLIPGT